jgi:hypothetical protein
VITSKTTSPQNHGEGRLHHRSLDSHCSTVAGWLCVGSGSGMSEIMPVPLGCNGRFGDLIDGSVYVT